MGWLKVSTHPPSWSFLGLAVVRVICLARNPFKETIMGSRVLKHSLRLAGNAPKLRQLPILTRANWYPETWFEHG